MNQSIKEVEDPFHRIVWGAIAVLSLVLACSVSDKKQQAPAIKTECLKSGAVKGHK